MGNFRKSFIRNIEKPLPLREVEERRLFALEKMTTERQHDKAVRVSERSRKGRSETPFFLRQEKKRQSTKLEGSKLKASERQDFFWHDGQLAVGACCQESGA